MIPDYIVELLNGASNLHIGSRDDAMQPSIARAVGPVAVEDGEVLTTFAAQCTAPALLANCRDNGRLALVGSRLEGFETYQLKGAFIDSRECTPEEIEAIDAVVARFEEFLIGLGYPAEIVRPYVSYFTPCVAVRFRVEQIFEQTPKPGTGEPLS